jgi:hypothetical protein
VVVDDVESSQWKTTVMLSKRATLPLSSCPAMLDRASLSSSDVAPGSIGAVLDISIHPDDSDAV